MTFNVSADAYARFMGRFSEPLAVLFADFARVRPGEHALDVGCGPGALTAELVRRLGADAVTAVDPSASFVAAVSARLPGVDVRPGVAESLPFGDASFDVVAAQLVVHFMTDPVAGLREMARVARPGGRIAACVWDHAGGGGPLDAFWRAVRDMDAQASDESGLPGTREGQLGELCESAGVSDIEASSLTVKIRFASFADWWEPFTLGVGPAGAHVNGLGTPQREALRLRCAQLLPDARFDISASAWAVCARV